jgi:hypothetical protein
MFYVLKICTEVYQKQGKIIKYYLETNIRSHKNYIGMSKSIFFEIVLDKLYGFY